MQASSNLSKTLPEPQKLPKLNRRQFLASLASLSALTLVHEKALKLLGLSSSNEKIVERTIVINRWIAKVNDSLVGIHSFRKYLSDANAQDPKQVDGLEAMRLMWDCKDACDELAVTIECGSKLFNPDELLVILSGDPLGYFCLKDWIITGDSEADRLQAEVNAFCEDYPQYKSELQALLDARGGAS